MKIGLIDVDSHNFPNLPLMKLSAWHKTQGDTVEWYSPMFSGQMDRVYISKVFSFTPDYEYYINAKEIIRGGGGYATKLEDGKEVFHKELDTQLPHDIEHIYPDYSLYPDLTLDTAYGFMTRGCPRGCDFCIVGNKEGRKAYTVAPLEEFWHGQKNIVLLDPNPIAAHEWKNNLQQLIDSKSWVDFTQGVDIRLMTEEKAEYIRQIKLKSIHFAWDRYEDREIVIPRLKMFKEITGIDRRKAIVYVLVNFNTDLEQDLERIYTLRDIGYDPYVMVYQKDKTNSKEPVRRLQRWVNNKRIFCTVKRFEEYNRAFG